MLADGARASSASAFVNVHVNAHAHANTFHQRALQKDTTNTLPSPFVHNVNANANVNVNANVRNYNSKRYMNYVRTEEDDALDSFLEGATSNDDFFASPDQFPSFQSLGIQSPILLQRVTAMLEEHGKTKKASAAAAAAAAARPSAVQAASFTAITSGKDVNIGAETGSGKTLAYLLPLIDDILQKKKAALDEETGKVGHLGYDYARAVILVPNKELANQVLRMAAELCGGPASIVWGTNGENMMTSGGEEVAVVEDQDIVRLGIMPGGLDSPDDYKPIRMAVNNPMNHAPLDLIITTPASLGPIGENPKNIDMFADIETVVIDEADMLFDGGYLRPLNNVLLGFKRADRLESSFGYGDDDGGGGGGYGPKKTQHVLVAATLPDMGLRSADAYVQKKFPFATKVTMKGMHNARHYGLKDQTVWIQDDYDEETPKKKRMERLIEILQTDSSSGSGSGEGEGEGEVGLAGEKVMVFLNSVGDVDSATGAFTRAGINAIPFHAKISIEDRTEYLRRFRKYDATAEENDEDAASVLVCTDLAARGLDIPGVTSVVQLQFAGNVVSHLHRMGRCGRAGKRDGGGVIFFGGAECELVAVVRKADEDQSTMVLKGNDIEEHEEQPCQCEGGRHHKLKFHKYCSVIPLLYKCL